jgi:curved DNA-binding protein CbpA
MASRRNHYQVLGVSPLATDAEIKAAFRSRARALHPDQNATKTAVDQQSSAGELMAVTEAWRVLHDPQRRFDYDMAQLSSVNVPPRPAPAARPAPQRASATRPSPQPEAEPSPEQHTGRGIPWIGVLVVLAIIFVFTAFAAAHRGSDPSSPLVGL